MADKMHGFGLGVISENAKGAILDVFYPHTPWRCDRPAVRRSQRAFVVDWIVVTLKTLANNARSAGDEALAALSDRLSESPASVVASSLGSQCRPRVGRGRLPQTSYAVTSTREASWH